jgi:hypothetical protein
VTFEETIAKSGELDRFLEKTRELMPITDGQPIFSISDIVAEIKSIKNDIGVKVRAELAGMRDDLKANGDLLVGKVRTERTAAREEFTAMLGNEIVDTSVKSDG